MSDAETATLTKAERKAAKKARKAKEKEENGHEEEAEQVEPEVVEEPKKSKKGKKRNREEKPAETEEQTEETAEPEPSPVKKSKKGKKKDKEAETSVSNGVEETEDTEQTEVKKSKKGKKRSRDEEAVTGERPASAEAHAAATLAAGVITVEGMDVTPLTDFKNTGFPKVLVSFLTSQKFTTPTPIQAHCWPVLSAARDIVGIAETGSGKTLAFSLPGMKHILEGTPSKVGPTMLVLAPTRELALQSAEVISQAGTHCGIACACIYGGVPKHEQKKALRGTSGKGGAQVVVATPGRLQDIVGEGACDLSGVTYLVLDEADRMLDMGFEVAVREIISWTAVKRQTAMFSATWPKEIRELAQEFLTNPVKVTVGDDDLTANVRVAQHVEVIGERDRDARLLELLQKVHSSRDNRVLVFALYKKEAVRIESMLRSRGWNSVAVHGDKSQQDREKALASFKNKSVPLMIATDVAARGLDIPDVEFVINYSFPLETSGYIHRIGRTGRAGKSGVSYTFFHAGDKGRAGELVNVLTDAGQVVPEALLKFGTHVKKKEHKLYGAFAKDIDNAKKATKITFEDSD